MKNNFLNEEKKLIFQLFNEKKFKKISKISKSNYNKIINDTDLLKLVILSEVNIKNFLKAESLAKVLLKNNQSSDYFYLYGNILKLQNKHDEAIIAFQNSIKLDKNFSSAYNNLANSQKKIGLIDEAQQNYEKSILTNKNNLEAYFNLANLFWSKREYILAIKNYEEAIKINKEFAEAYSNIGQIYASLGRFKDAEKFLKIAIQKDNNHSISYKNYFLIKSIKEDNEIYLKLKTVIKNPNLKIFDKQNMLYSLSKASFDIGNDDEAFKYLEVANDLKIQETKFSINKVKKKYEKLKTIFNEKDNSKIVYQDKYNSTPIFIVGMPRSGTSLVEQIISSHSSVYGGGELSYLPETINSVDHQLKSYFIDSLKYIRKNYLSKLNKLSKKNFITDKLPGNFKFIGLILEAIPEAKVIHISRNPMAVCWSNFKSNFINNNGMEYTLKQEHIAEFYISYHRLMDYWKSKYYNKIININYENFVENYNIEIKDLIGKLNLKWEDQILEFYKNNDRAVETASFMQVRKKIYSNSSEEWKKYSSYLQVMIKKLSFNNINF